MGQTQRMTFGRTGSVGGYMIPIRRAGAMRIEFEYVHGDIVDRLGQFEDLGMEPEEIKRELAVAARYRELIKYWEKEKE